MKLFYLLVKSQFRLFDALNGVEHDDQKIGLRRGIQSMEAFLFAHLANASAPGVSTMVNSPGVGGLVDSRGARQRAHLGMVFRILRELIVSVEFPTNSRALQ